MQAGACLLFLLSAYPMARAWRFNRQTALVHAVYWGIAAWCAWAGAMTSSLGTGRLATSPYPTYAALCLTGCASVAILGARRPGVAAWNFVVAGLLAVMCLPLVENVFIRKPLGDPVAIALLAGTIGVGVLNFLPTRLAPAALLIGLGCAANLMILSDEAQEGAEFGRWMLALAPWLGLAVWQGFPKATSDFDQAWLRFRDRFGFLWGQRARDQFNRAAANAGGTFWLSWGGLRSLTNAEMPVAAEIAARETLSALLTRHELKAGASTHAASPKRAW